MQWNINRINDYLFKWVFGREENKDILLSFVNSVLSGEDNDGQDELVDIMLADRELDPEHITDQSARLDILGKANDGSILNIEVQIADLHNICFTGLNCTKDNCRQGSSIMSWRE